MKCMLRVLTTEERRRVKSFLNSKSTIPVSERTLFVVKHKFFLTGCKSYCGTV